VDGLVRGLEQAWATQRDRLVRCAGEHATSQECADQQPRKIRQELDAIMASTRDMPSRMRQYAAFEFVQDTIRALLKANILVSELKSEALRERHWSKLYKSLRMPSGYSASSMTLGQVYDLDLKRNESLIKEVVIQAQGEMALEEFLKQVRETWTSYSLDLVNYQNKCRLIRCVIHDAVC